MDDRLSPDDSLQRELQYYKKKLDELSGQSIRNDYALSSLRYELKQKKDAFAILSNLQTEFTVDTPFDVIYSKTVVSINTYLGMERSIVLVKTNVEHTFQASHWYGFPEEQSVKFENIDVTILPEQYKAGQYLLLNKSRNIGEIGTRIQQAFSMNYFIGVPIVQDGSPIAFIITGRQFEKMPFIPPLDKADVDTLLAIASLISTAAQNKSMMDMKFQIDKQLKENKIITSMLAELKATQAQLIQKEKMASLGELTAGIAHEIQNPLNFVNNFSETNVELLTELKQEIKNRNIEEVGAITSDLIENEQKINYHGKRADAIVKAMMQHARTPTGEKLLTDINALVDEYLRLAYHGFRTKDKSFNTNIETHFDESIGNVNIIPQEIGRVLLNLFNNAFYSMQQKKARYDEAYKPLLEVSTMEKGDIIYISVKDNGMGIPLIIMDKIFQPFFTTKPTGEGTGLGLSLSYDIVKAHGGELKLESTNEEGATFIILLPIA